MFVMRELDRELAFVLRLCCLAGHIRFGEGESRIFARRRTHVTDRTNRRTRAAEGLPRKKLLSMTTDTGVVAWKVSHVGEVTFRSPFSWDLVAGITGETFVFVR